MLKILLVEDDTVVARIYRGKLQDAGYQVLVAEDGLIATKLLKEFNPDVVVLDLLIPKLNGLDVLKFMRQDPELKSIRVVVFSNAFLNQLWEQVAALGVQEMLLKATATPPQLIKTISRVLQQPSTRLHAPAAAVALQSMTGETAPPAPTLAPASAGAGTTERVQRNESAADFRKRIRRDFFAQIPAIARGIREAFRDFLENPQTATPSTRLQGLQRKIDFLTHMTGMAGCYRIAQLSSALEALLFELQLKPATLTDSVRRTILATVTLLDECLVRAEEPDGQCLSPTSILVVDDDAVSCRALVMTLARANLTARSVPDAFRALEKLRQNSYDLVILDINLPGMSGISLCEEMRRMPLHGKTPVIFITSYAEFEPRARSILGKADDLIAKPIMPVELTVKVIANVLQRRLPATGLAALA